MMECFLPTPQTVLVNTSSSQDHITMFQCTRTIPMMLRPLTAFHTKSAMMAFRPGPQRTTTRMTTLRFQHDSSGDDERLPVVLDGNMNLTGKTSAGIEVSGKNELKTVKFNLKFDRKEELKEVKTELEEVRTELKEDIGSLHTTLEAVQIEVKKDIGSVKNDLEAVKSVVKEVDFVVKEVMTELKEVMTELKEVKTQLQEVMTELKEVKPELKEGGIGSLKTKLLEGIVKGIGWCGTQIAPLILFIVVFFIGVFGGMYMVLLEANVRAYRDMRDFIRNLEADFKKRC
jgi:hypothetical protein